MSLQKKVRVLAGFVVTVLLAYSSMSSTPGLKDAPILGKLFQSFNRNDQTTDLIVMVNPVVVRSPIADSATWSFPDREELLRAVMAGLPPAAPAPPATPSTTRRSRGRRPQ